MYIFHIKTYRAYFEEQWVQKPYGKDGTITHSKTLNVSNDIYAGVMLVRDVAD